MITVLQIFMVLLLIVLIVIMVFKPRKKQVFSLPEHYKELLQDYVPFYHNLHENDKKHFEERLEKFYAAVKITGVNAEVEDLDRVLTGAAAIIPVFNIPDWEYVHLKEVLVYPGNFNTDFDQYGNSRDVLGMVGTGALQNVLIISKWELRQNFLNTNSKRNTAIHEYAHLIDKMDGTLDGVPEILLERKHVARWKQLLQQTIQQVGQGTSDIDIYAATNEVECFAVLAEYFFSQPYLFRSNHPELNEMMQRIFRTV